MRKLNIHNKINYLSAFIVAISILFSISVHAEIKPNVFSLSDLKFNLLLKTNKPVSITSELTWQQCKSQNMPAANKTLKKQNIEAHIYAALNEILFHAVITRNNINEITLNKRELTKINNTLNINIKEFGACVDTLTINPEN